MAGEYLWDGKLTKYWTKLFFFLAFISLILLLLAADSGRYVIVKASLVVGGSCSVSHDMDFIY